MALAQMETASQTEGPIAKAISDDMERRKGLLTAADLASHKSDWTEPISTDYRGYNVLEFPPNTQGVVALEMLNIVEGYDIKALGHNMPLSLPVPQLAVVFGVLVVITALAGVLPARRAARVSPVTALGME